MVRNTLELMGIFLVPLALFVMLGAMFNTTKLAKGRNEAANLMVRGIK